MKKKLLTILMVSVLIVCTLGLFACSNISFKLSFIVDGETYQTIETNGSERIDIPENPVKDSYIFDGWFWDNDVWEKPFTANSLLDAPISSDMKVYAKFREEHTHNYIESVVEPTCTEKGYTTYTCTCGDSYIDSYTSALGHDLGEYVSDNNATYDNDGTKTATCTHSGCGVTDTIIDEYSRYYEFTFEKMPYSTGYAMIRYKGNRSSVSVPSHYKGEPVVAIGKDGATSVNESGFANYLDLTSVALPDSVKYIYNNAFQSTSIKEIVIPSGVTSIGSSAFEGCSSLENVVIPSSVISIGDSVFYNCNNIKNANIPTSFISTIPKGNLKTVVINSGTRIETSAFFGCSSLESITISNSVTSIGEMAFYHCSILESITLPFVGATLNGTSNTHFGYIFGAKDYQENYSCVPTSLKNVTITGGNSIDFRAFYNCSSLESITLPFVGATLNGTTNTHFGYIFGAEICSYNNSYVPTSLKSVTITGGNSIGSSAFDGCSSLESITIPNSVTSIGSSAFDGCSSLESITLPFLGATLNATTDTHFGYIFGSSSYIYNSSYVPTSLKSVTITGGNSIDSSAFYNCSSLESIEIPSSVTSIGTNVFWNCSSLQYNKYNNGKYLGNSENEYLVLIGAIDTTCTSFEISFDTKIIYLSAFSGCSRLKSITIPESVTSIGDYTFSRCYNLITVTFEDDSKLESIGSYAFYYCSSLESITIPSSVTNIGGSAFYDCYNLQSVTFEEDSKLETIGDYAFYNCSSLESITLPFVGATLNVTSNTHFGYIFGAKDYQENYSCVPTSLKNVTITGGNSIDFRAFYECSSLESITIPNSVTSIGEMAFYNCSSLTSITLPFVGASKTAMGYSSVFGCIFGYTTSDSFLPVSGATYQYMSDGGTYYHYYIPSSLRSVTITGGSINNGAFRECSSLTSITIPSSVTSIGDYAFYYCSSLKTVTFEEGSKLESIGYSAFRECSSLTSITIPSSVTSIGGLAFSVCDSLESITIPSSVTSIGEMAFSVCSNLTSVIFEDTSTWFYTSTENHNFTGGIVIGVTDANYNATYLKSIYYNKYWYKT